MIFKLLSELSICELRLVFRRAGRLGLFSESRAIVQLTVYLVSNGQNPFTYRFPILESDVNTSDAIQVEVAEDSHLGVKVAADDLPEDLTGSGYYLVPRCKTASEECSIFAVLSVSSLVIKSKEQSCFGEHSAEPFACTVDKSNNGDKVGK